MKTPDEWMREFEAKIADAKVKAEAVQRGLESAQGTASSKDGAVTVTVAPNGALTDVRLTADAMRKSHAQLSAEIVAVARQAQRSAAVQVAETFEAVNGTDSETYRLITEYLPPDEEQEEDALERPRYAFEQEFDGGSPPPPQPPPRREPPRRTAPRDGVDDDRDFSSESIFKNQ
ncbi:DNA-binding protein YbaB [Saccharothrix tamanrassetensis]|uniref:DNA-binding protein YbaB n=1 Tax=Saccharothrix tamanrassetensis TaxID=1051531 RepID=A0A841CG82_9PSEU|nr:YbaB/EbfC family nucleoid-associated protein [Saccharothrix tamanrassetensis]MBB5956003.1 DNA-binding protein YbaB [Saccharothrix tamanrassetensis]